MPKHIHTPIIPNKHYNNAEEYLLQAQALNLALWTSSDVHEQIKPVCGMMAELLSKINTELINMLDDNKGGEE